MQICDAFPRYTEHDPSVPVWCVTPGTGRTFHRFFDTSPFSPSGRLMAFFRMPSEEIPPAPGDEGEIVVVDLQTAEERIVDKTRGWEAQMGPNLNWGADDNTLIYNDVDTSSWKSFVVRFDLASGERKRVGVGVYHVSPDGKKALCSNPPAMRRTQEGYGVVVPDEAVPRNIGLRDDDGLYVTDIEGGESKLLVSLKEVIQRTAPKSDWGYYDDREVYGFHSKWNPQGDRLIFTVRHFPKDLDQRFNVLHGANKQLRYDVYTMREDGSELYNAVPAPNWDKGGHHINWFPDGVTLSMNLNIDKQGMRFVRANHDGTGLEKMMEDPPGSGHPTVHPNGRHIVTDSYPHEPIAFEDKSIPIRLVDRQTLEEKCLVRMRTLTKAQKKHPALRVDPHPAWDRTNRYLAFNGFADGTRRVYVADLSDVVGEW